MSAPDHGHTPVVLLGTPFTALDAWGRRFAQSLGGIWLGDLNLSMAASVEELLQFYAVAQVPLHEPFFATLRQHVQDAATDPEAFLQERADWSMHELVQYLVASLDAPAIFSDVSAGFRIHQVERWFAMLPGAVFVHATSELAPFADTARKFYSGQLYVPPDYRDHCVAHAVPVIKPELAWYQVHATLARAFHQASGVRRCRLALEAAPPATLWTLGTLADEQAAEGRFTYPYAKDAPTAMAPSLDQLRGWLGR